ncbi:hypothetical protein ACET3Z_004410 [Daucus carota]
MVAGWTKTSMGIALSDKPVLAGRLRRVEEGGLEIVLNDSGIRCNKYCKGKQGCIDCMCWISSPVEEGLAMIISSDLDATVIVTVQTTNDAIEIV